MTVDAVSLGEYLNGVGLFTIVWGSSACTALLVVRSLPRLEGPPRAVALSLVFLTVLLAAHLIPGALGLLRPGGVALTAMLGTLVAWRATRRVPQVESTALAPPPLHSGESGRASRWIALAVAVAVAAVALAGLAGVRNRAPDHVDALSFALPGVAGWIGTHSIWHVGAFLPYLQVRTYPTNGDLLSLAAILPWHDDAFLRVLALPLLGLTALSVYAIGQELRAGGVTSTLLATAAVSPSVILATAIDELKPDAFMYATFAGGLFFLVRHGRTGRRADLLLAGVGLGLAFGSRWYGLTTVALLEVVWVGALLAARRPPRMVARDLVLLSGTVLATGGFWLVRNIVLTGNPLYPIKLGVGGFTLLDAPRDVFTVKFGFTVAHRLTQPGFAGGTLISALGGAFGGTGLVALVGVLIAAVMVAGRGRSAVNGRGLALVAAAGMVAATYLLLPGGGQGFPDRPFPGIVEANLRWLVPALLLALAAAGWAAARLRWGRRVAATGLLASVAVTLPAALPGVAVGSVLAWAGALAALVVAVPRLARGVRLGLPSWRGRARVAVIGALALLSLLFAGYEHQRTYDPQRYVGRSAAVDWVDAHAPSGRKIGVTGNWSAARFVPIYPLFGPRLGNDVSYVGPLVDQQLREYTDAGAFTVALRRARYDLLAVGTLSRPNLEHLMPQRRLSEPVEARWAQTAGYVEVARDADFVLLARQAR